MKRIYILIALFLLVYCPNSTAAVYTVQPNSDGDCVDFDCNLQIALNAAAGNGEADVIEVEAGDFNAKVEYVYSPEAENFPLTITGAGRDSTVIDGSISIDTTGLPDDSNSTISLSDISFAGDAGANIMTNQAVIQVADIRMEYFHISSDRASIHFNGDISIDSALDITLDSGSIVFPGESNTDSGCTLNTDRGITLSSGRGQPVEIGTATCDAILTGEVSVTASDYGSVTGIDPGSVTLVSPGVVLKITPPVYEALIRLVTFEGQTVTLNSADETGDGWWRQTEGPYVPLADSAALSTTFVAPIVSGDSVNMTFERVIEQDGDIRVLQRMGFAVEDNGINDFPNGVMPFVAATGDHLGITISDNGDLTRLNSINVASGIALPGRPEQLPFGLVDMEILVDHPGDMVRVDIHLPRAAPADYSWFKYNATHGWMDFGPYTEYNQDRTVVTLTLTDGGIGDDDGVANGVIRDPSGLGSMVTSPAVTEGDGGGGGCFISSVR